MIKQWIIVRRYFPDGKNGLRKLRLGKYISQACHASIAFICDKIKRSQHLSEEERKWLDDGFTKICLYVDSEEELLSLHNTAIDMKLTSHIIIDNGVTEFGGNSTPTCVAIGPHKEDKVKELVGELKLL